MGIPTISDIVNTKKLSNEKYEEEIEKLNLFSGNQNVYNLSGNPIIYHHQMVNLLKVRSGNNKSVTEGFIFGGPHSVCRTAGLPARNRYIGTENLVHCYNTEFSW